MNALADYIRWRLKNESDIKEGGFDQDLHVAKYREFLEALDVKPDEPLFESLMEHMSQMKDAPPPPAVAPANSPVGRRIGEGGRERASTFRLKSRLWYTSLAFIAAVSTPAADFRTCEQTLQAAPLERSAAECFSNTGAGKTSAHEALRRLKNAEPLSRVRLADLLPGHTQLSTKRSRQSCPL